MTATRLVRTPFVMNDDQRRQFWSYWTALFNPITEHHEVMFRRKVARMVKAKPGAVVLLDTGSERQGWRLRKFMAMVGHAFDAWDPDFARTKRVYKGATLQKEFEAFRKDVTIKAGFYTAHYHLDGSVRLEAKSIAFDAMEEDEFVQVYDAVAGVLLAHFLTNYTRNDLDAVVDELVRFTESHA